MSFRSFVSWMREVLRVVSLLSAPSIPCNPPNPTQTPALFSVQHDLRRAMACEITAVNDDLDDETIAFIEKHASILDEDDPFLVFCDVLDDRQVIFRSMDQLSRLSFTTTMIPEFGKLFGYLVAAEKRIPSTKLLQRISLSILRSAGGDQSLCCQKLAQLIQFICAATVFNLESCTKAATVSRVSMATPVPARPVASVNPSPASAQSGLCPKSPSTVKQPPGKVTAHCIDPSAAPLQLGGAKKKDRVEEKAGSNPFAVRPAVAQQPAQFGNPFAKDTIMWSLAVSSEKLVLLSLAYLPYSRIFSAVEKTSIQD
ncbi:hypothetical protein PAPYR_10658 [Paratrimastix pyriformis]|uniref:Uncharacterized protein n=1 Tax=Paratrimastix pyriformis TaxID=342808 RepID=A0ABQ8U9N4_9EUKA|nr:hypothetical protein PAPYR_10658 [Paratrimastix pyriformis]